MKKTILIILVLILAVLGALSEKRSFDKNTGLIPKGEYAGGILKNESSEYSRISNYNLEVKFDPDSKYIFVNEEIIWRNLTPFSTGELQFHLYPNAYKNDKTIFASAYKITPERSTQVEILQLNVDGKPAEFVYFQPETKNPYDSTTAKILLSRMVKSNDSVKVKIEYKMKIPVSVKRLGYASGRNFYFISQWFPKLGVFEEGSWVCSQYYPYLNFYSDFGDYNVKIETPQNYTVGATGSGELKESANGKNIFNFIQKGVHDFVWFAADEIMHKQRLFKRNDGSEILVNAYVQPEREKYFNRYFEAVENSLRFFEKYIGSYPYRTLTLVDVPRTCAAGGMEYPTLFTVEADLFSPVGTRQPERVTIHEFSHQFFYGLLANNEVYNAWLDEGFATYITEKILNEYYGEEYISFKFAGYIPLNGMNLYSIGEIPVVYTVSNILTGEGAGFLQAYYKNLSIGSIADTSYKLPNLDSYVVNSYYKPALMLLTLQNYVGFNKMMNILKDYYNVFKYKHPKEKDFFAVVRKNCDEDMGWFFDNFIDNPYLFDYRIKSITKKSGDEYEVLAERCGDGFFKNKIAFCTSSDTLYQNWDSHERWKIFTFNTKNEVIGAEVDPGRKNMLDINFANNSLTLKPRYGASISLAMRWFFWVQNALMTLGGIG